MSVFDQLRDLSDHQLRNLVAVSVQVILSAENLPEEIPEDLFEISPRGAAIELSKFFEGIEANASPEKLQKILHDQKLSSDLCIEVLKEIRRHPILAKKIEEAYNARENQLAEPTTLLLAGALVILAIRIKKIRWTDQNKEIEFDKSGKAVEGFVSNILRKIIL